MHEDEIGNLWEPIDKRTDYYQASTETLDELSKQLNQSKFSYGSTTSTTLTNTHYTNIVDAGTTIRGVTDIVEDCNTIKVLKDQVSELQNDSARGLSDRIAVIESAMVQLEETVNQQITALVEILEQTLQQNQQLHQEIVQLKQTITK